jgi:hypothetical protein
MPKAVAFGSVVSDKFQSFDFNKRLFFDDGPERIVKRRGSIVP